MNRFARLTRDNTPIFMTVLLGLRVIGTLLSYVNPAFYFLLFAFDPEAIASGQIWRLFTFVMYPYGSGFSSLFFLAIMTFVYFSIGQTLIQVIGKFRLNFFLISGLVLEALMGFLYFFLAGRIPTLGAYWYYLNPTYLYSMIFVLFAMMFPDIRIYLMFFIPIRGKYMVFVTLGLYLLEVLQAFFTVGVGYAWILVMMIIAAIVTMLLYLLVFRNGNPFIKNTRTQKKGQRNRHTAKDPSKIRASQKTVRHQCAICGRTEKSNPELEFRYCSKCIGNYEYCTDHLYTHLHKYPNVTDGTNKKSV